MLARVLGIPYPIVLVLGALPLGFIPGVPEVELDPELVLVIFLPPLLYVAAFFANLRELRRDARPISLLAIGLVALTTCVVAVVAHTLIDGLPWAAAFALGAIVSPTDPVAATATARRLGAPRRLVTIIEGESLVNDAIERVSGSYGFRRRRGVGQVGEEDDRDYELRSQAYQRLLHGVIQAQREVLLRLRDDGEISSEVMRRVERELDLEEERLEF